MAAGALALTLVGAQAGVGAGTYTVDMAGVDELWDVSGHYHQDLEDMSLDYTLNMDPSGKFTGYGDATVSGFSGYHVHLDINFTLNGTLKSSGNTVKVDMTMKLSGSGTVQGYAVTFSGKISESMALNMLTRQLVGTASGSMTVAVPSERVRETAKIPKMVVDTSLPYNMDGTWDLTLSPTVNKNKYSGTAQATLSNGRVVGMTMTGTHTPKTDISKLTLKGTGASLNLSTIFSQYGPVIKTLSGKALGQNLKK